MGKSTKIIQDLNDLILTQQKEIHRLELELMKAGLSPPVVNLIPPVVNLIPPVVKSATVKPYLEEILPSAVSIQEFIELIRRDEIDHEGDVICCFEDKDLISVYDGGNYDESIDIKWTLDIIERFINKFTRPLRYRPFHCIRDSKSHPVMCFKDKGEWVTDNDAFEKYLNRILHGMSAILTKRIIRIHEPIIEYLNEQNRLFRCNVDEFGNLIECKHFDGNDKTLPMLAIATMLNNNAANPYNMMVAFKIKFTLDSEDVAEDTKKPFRKLHKVIEDKTKITKITKILDN